VSQLIAAKAFRSKRCFLISEFGFKVRPLLAGLAFVSQKMYSRVSSVVLILPYSHIAQIRRCGIRQRPFESDQNTNVSFIDNCTFAIDLSGYGCDF